MAEGQYKFGISLDTRQLRVNVQEAKKMFEGLSLAASKMGKGIDDSFVQPIVSASSPLANIPKQVGAATQSFNGLNVATQQLVRELPAASMGLNTLFLAMSNNLPIFADQVKQLRENGESVGDIFKEFGKSLFSWQTALVVGVTLLASYGKEIGNFVTSLFKGKEAIDATKKAQEGLNKTIKENGLGIGDSFVKLRQLGREYRLLGDNINARKQFILDNKSAFDDLGVAINSVVDADRLLIERTPDFVQAMMLRAQASAAKRLAEEKYEEFFIKRQEYIDERDAGVSAADRFNAMASGLDQSAATGKTTGKIQTAEELYQNRINILKDEAIEVKNTADAYFELSAAKDLEATTILRNAGITEANANAIKAEAKTLQELHDDIFGSEAEQTADINRAFNKMRKDLAESRAKSIEDLEQYYIDYGTFQERLLATTQRYNRLIAEAENEGQRLSLEAERDAILAQYEVEASAWADELIGKTTEQIEAMLSELEVSLSMSEAMRDAVGDSQSADAKAYQAEINKLLAQIKILKQRLGEAEEEIADDNWADAIQVFQNISKAAQDAAEGIEEFDEGAASVLRTMAQLAGTAINLIGAIQAVSKAATAAAGTISAMEKASVILAVIGAAIQAVSALFSLFKGSDEVEQTMRQFEELNKELERFRKLSQIDSVEGTIFGDNAFGNFANNLRVMQEAYQELEATRQTIETNSYDNQLSYFERLLERYEREGNLRSAAYIQKKIDELKASGLANQGLANTLSGMTVKLGKNRSSTLGEQLPELFAGGEVTLDALKMLQESDVWDKLSQENKDLIDELIANWERYDESIEATNAYLRNIFGELGDNITNALVDAFENGTDAMLAFGEAAGDMLERLAADMVRTALVQPIIDEAMKQVEAINAEDGLTAEERVNRLIGIIGGMLEDVAAQQDEVDATLEGIQQRVKEDTGFDIFAGNERTGASKGIAQASQESITELNGRMTAIQSHTYSIMESVSALAVNSGRALQHLAGIENNTARLAAIERDMGAMAADISDMATRGINVRM